jgi:hypothetical protein
MRERRRGFNFFSREFQQIRKITAKKPNTFKVQELPDQKYNILLMNNFSVPGDRQMLDEEKIQI